MSRVFMRGLALTAGLALAISAGVAFHEGTKADSKPAVELRIDQAGPREVNETVQQSLVRDYSAAWQALAVALANNNAAPLNYNFLGFSQDQLARHLIVQQHPALRTH